MYMAIRAVQHPDRSEWIRMLRALYQGTTEAEHAIDVDPYLEGRPSGRPPHAAVLVHEREDGGGLGGFLELSLRNYAEGCTGETPYVESWYVDPDLRGGGVGRELMTAAEAWARSHGYREIASDLVLENEPSLRAHTAIGFEEVVRVIHLRKAL
jgi:aminoglycoside 6'-N-acetyltransferase I